MGIKKRVFSTTIDVAQRLSAQILEWLNEDKSRNFYVALSGGSTPAMLFQVWTEFYRTRFDWNRIFFYWVDERCVDPRHPDSNFGMAKKILFDHINIPARNIQRIFGEIDTDFEVKRYSGRLFESVPIKNGKPYFDLVLLGLGEDGHTASIFPDNLQLIDSPDLCAVARHPQTGNERITITGPVIANAGHVVFFVTGDSKADIVHRIVDDLPGSSHLPASIIKERCSDCYFYLDQTSARAIYFQ